MLSCQRERFSLGAGVHYLNAAYMGPLSFGSQDAAARAVQAKARPFTIGVADFFRDSDAARELFSRIVNAPDPRNVAIVPSVSYGVTIAARNLQAHAGQRVVVVGEEFPSNVYPWRAVARDQNLECVAVAAPQAVARRADAWNERLLEAITPGTACVAVPQVHWTDGLRFDLESISDRCREVGAALVIDATQSAGAMPFDFERIRPDALVVAAYKWLLGPYSVAFAWLGERFAAGRPLEETWLGRQGSEDFAGLVIYQDDYQPGALRHDMGERANLMLMPVAVNAMQELLEWGVPEVQQYCRSLTDRLVDSLADTGYTTDLAEDRCGHLIGLRLPGNTDATRLQQLLVDRHIFVSRRGSALRVAPHVYNDAADMDALAEALRAG